MPTLDVLGHPTWFAVHGDGDETVLLLHGGLSNSDALLDSIGAPLAERRRVAAFDRRGHGRTADTPEAFHYESMVDETIAFIEHIGAPVHIVGWSDGGIVGLLLALRRPELVGRLVAIGANFHWNMSTGVAGVTPSATEPAADSDHDPSDDSMMVQIAAAYAERSPDGADHWAAVAAKGFHLFGIEPELTVDDLARVSVPVLVMAGDDDLIPLGHTTAFYAALPEAQLAIVPGSSHGLPMEHPHEVARLIDRFLSSDVPPVTMMPNLRS
ncbi:MAG: alpha/beta hydrolase [Actinomycetota bacterium]|nr:alpha/beta hydrolase [Actinomycetota bacterium]